MLSEDGLPLVLGLIKKIMSFFTPHQLHLWPQRYCVSLCGNQTDIPAVFFPPVNSIFFEPPLVKSSQKLAFFKYELTRVDIWRDQCDRRSCKFFVSRVNFSQNNA